MEKKLVVLVILLLTCSLLNATEDKVSSINFKKEIDSMIKNFKTNTISVEQLSDLQRIENKAPGSFIIIDAREKKEFEISHIKGALFYSSELLKKLRLQKVKPEKIVVYCSVGYRSGKVSEILSKEGFVSYNLYGGIFEWVNLGHQVVDQADAPTERVHTYNKDWSKWMTVGKPIW